MTSPTIIVEFESRLIQAGLEAHLVQFLSSHGVGLTWKAARHREGTLLHAMRIGNMFGCIQFV
jgi:hypothetical protein